MKRLGRQEGFGLIEAMIAAALGVVVLLALSSGLQSTFKASRKLDSTTDLAAVKMALSSAVNCEETLRGRTPGNPCASAEYIVLRNDKGDEVVGSNGSRFGPWTVRARCSPGSRSLDIRAARFASGVSPSQAELDFSVRDKARFARDEMAGAPGPNTPQNRWTNYSWEHPKAQLFPVSATGLCSAFFSSAGSSVRSCSQPNSYITGVDFMNRTLECKPMPSCKDTELLVYDSGQFKCVPNKAKTTVDKLVENLKSGDLKDVTGGGEKRCGDASKMSCPNGYVAYGWSAWVTSSNITSCKVKCRRLLP